jgi:hypothetical protein
MRMFKSDDGKKWTAKLHEDVEVKPATDERAGWEIIQFDTEPPGKIQRITYRPAGWLALATIQELLVALREGDTVRANWRESPP